MNDTFSAVNVLVWDVDGTLYPPSEEMAQATLESAYITIEHRMGWPRHKAIEEFEKVHEKITPSQTEAVALICNIPTSEAARETDRNFQRTKYIARDEKLVSLFESLKGFRHFILGNGAQKTIREGIIALGLEINTFDEIVTSETVGANKPKDNGFKYILEKTGMPPGEHLMIGDREKIDLVPAKALGMKTCLVWALKPSMVADVTLPSVYELMQILI
jgi:HAD superfamily hydrolase (TIGR01549 family)